MESGRLGGVEEAPVGPQLRTGEDSKLSPSCYLSGIPFGCAPWQLVASESRNTFPVVSISGLCESKKDGEGLER